MPDDLPVQSCDIKQTSGGIKQAVGCSLTDGFVVLTNPFENEAYPGSKELSVVFRGLQLPNSERPILGITIETYDKANGKHFLVDRFQSLDYEFFTPNSVTFLFGRIQLSTEFTYTEARFSFKQTSATQIPAGSYIKVTVPSQIIVENTVSVASSCGPVSKMSANMKCEIVANTDGNVYDGTHTITITDGFENQLERNDEMIFEIKRGLLTPISTETTDSFKV